MVDGIGRWVGCSKDKGPINGGAGGRAGRGSGGEG